MTAAQTRVVWTMPGEESTAVCARLRAAGLPVWHEPLITTHTIVPNEALDGAVVALRSRVRPWVALTSKHAVDAFFEAAGRVGFAREELARARFAAVGDATARALGAHHVEAALVPARSTAAALASELRERCKRTDVVLFPRATRAREELVAVLGAAGIAVEAIDAYETVPAPLDERAFRARLGEMEPTHLVLGSGSAVGALVSLLGTDGARELLGHVTTLAIGPTCEAEAIRAGATRTRQPERPGVRALEALVRSEAGLD